MRVFANKWAFISISFALVIFGAFWLKTGGELTPANIGLLLSIIAAETGMTYVLLKKHS